MKSKNVGIWIFIVGVIISIYNILKSKFQKPIIDDSLVWNPNESDESL